MSVEMALVVTVISVTFGIYVGVSNLRLNEKKDIETGTSGLTTVIVKLENIGIGISEIKSELNSVKNDMKEDRERIVRVEESVKQAHKRLDGFCSKHMVDDEE